MNKGRDLWSECIRKYRKRCCRKLIKNYIKEREIKQQLSHCAMSITVGNIMEQWMLCNCVGKCFFFLLMINPLPDKPILGSSGSAANKEMMSKTWTNGDTII